VLLGSLSTVSAGDLWTHAALGGAVILRAGRGLRGPADDDVRPAARAAGVRVDALHHALFAGLAVAVDLACRPWGCHSAWRCWSWPAATARPWARTRLAMSAAAAALGVVSTSAGSTAAYRLATLPGATIALLAVSAFTAAWGLTLPRRGRLPASHARDLPALARK